MKILRIAVYSVLIIAVIAPVFSYAADSAEKQFTGVVLSYDRYPHNIGWELSDVIYLDLLFKNKVPTTHIILVGVCFLALSVFAFGLFRNKKFFIACSCLSLAILVVTMIKVSIDYINTNIAPRAVIVETCNSSIEAKVKDVKIFKNGIAVINMNNSLVPVNFKNIRFSTNKEL